MRPVFYVALISMIACSGADETGLTRVRGGETNGPATNTNATQPTNESDDVAPKSSSDHDPSTSSDPTPTTGTDAGADAAKAIDPNPFAGAPAYVATLGPSARKTAHPFTNDNPAGKPCFNCHGDNGAATPMAFGGTVYTSAAGTTGASKVEVRVKDKDGKAISAWSDADGNFFFFVNPNGDLNLPGHAGIRNAKGNKVMSATIANGNCNGCHNANNAAGRLVAPN
jgi:hypothetical protein